MKLFKQYTIIFLLFLLPINLIHAQNSNDIISDITIEGNQRVEIDTINSYLNINVGEAYDLDKLNNSIMRYLLLKIIIILILLNMLNISLMLK